MRWRDYLPRTKWMEEAAFAELQQTGVPVDWLNQNSSSRNFDPLSPSLKLMTMHTSKGLEFPVVFIPGLGYLPNAQGETAGEARLLDVAMTRAIEMLVLTGDGTARWKRSQVCVRGSAEGGAGESVLNSHRSMALT